MDNIQKEISEILKQSICESNMTYNRFLSRLKEGKLTEAENPRSHLIAYFVPFNHKTKEVFIVRHKDAELWLSPGGHINQGETLVNFLNREIEEELGVSSYYKQAPAPFLLTLTEIDKQNDVSKEHFDIWFLMETEGANFKPDNEEFHSASWMEIEEALGLVTDPANRSALLLLKNKP